MNVWINLGFWETAHLPLPSANINTYFSLKVDCLQSAFPLKIRLVRISSSAIASHDVITTLRFLVQ